MLQARVDAVVGGAELATAAAFWSIRSAAAAARVPYRARSFDGRVFFVGTIKADRDANGHRSRSVGQRRGLVQNPV